MNLLQGSKRKKILSWSTRLQHFKLNRIYWWWGFCVWWDTKKIIMNQWHLDKLLLHIGTTNNWFDWILYCKKKKKKRPISKPKSQWVIFFPFMTILFFMLQTQSSKQSWKWVARFFSSAAIFRIIVWSIVQTCSRYWKNYWIKTESEVI